MENICDRILELDAGRCFMHDFGGAGAYSQFKEVGAVDGCGEVWFGWWELGHRTGVDRPAAPSPHPPHPPLPCLLSLQAREFRRKSQANAAADARTLFRREAEWIVKQPKARQAKSQHRVKAFEELTARTKDVPKEDLKVSEGELESLVLKLSSNLPVSSLRVWVSESECLSQHPVPFSPPLAHFRRLISGKPPCSGRATRS